MVGIVAHRQSFFSPSSSSPLAKWLSIQPNIAFASRAARSYWNGGVFVFNNRQNATNANIARTYRPPVWPP
jgi:hypothetical protein